MKLRINVRTLVSEVPLVPVVVLQQPTGTTLLRIWPTAMLFAYLAIAFDYGLRKLSSPIRRTVASVLRGEGDPFWLHG